MPVLTHISLASHFWDIGKQCRPTSDAAECSFWSESSLFANRNIYWNRIKITKSTPDTPKIGNGLVQLIWMDGFTSQMWVKVRLQILYSQLCYWTWPRLWESIWHTANCATGPGLFVRVNLTYSQLYYWTRPRLWESIWHTANCATGPGLFVRVNLTYSQLRYWTRHRLWESIWPTTNCTTGPGIGCESQSDIQPTALLDPA